MSKKYAYLLGGQDREFRYTMDDREALEDRFNCGLLELIKTKVLPTEDGKGTGGGVLKAQVALVWMGVKHYGAAVTEKRVREWLLQEIEAKGNMFGPLAKAAEAIMASGVLGVKYEAQEDEPGKDAPAPEPAPAA